MAIPFQYESEYKRKLCTPDEAARVVKSGDWLDISMGCAFPSLMDAAIAKRKEELYGVKIRGYLIQQPIQMVECDPGREHFIYNSWHMSGYERKLCDRGMCSFNPMVFRNLGGLLSAFPDGQRGHDVRDPHEPARLLQLLPVQRLRPCGAG